MFYLTTNRIKRKPEPCIHYFISNGWNIDKIIFYHIIFNNQLLFGTWFREGFWKLKEYINIRKYYWSINTLYKYLHARNLKSSQNRSTDNIPWLPLTTWRTEWWRPSAWGSSHGGWYTPAPSCRWFSWSVPTVCRKGEPSAGVCSSPRGVYSQVHSPVVIIDKINVFVSKRGAMFYRYLAHYSPELCDTIGSDVWHHSTWFKTGFAPASFTNDIFLQ